MTTPVPAKEKRSNPAWKSLFFLVPLLVLGLPAGLVAYFIPKGWLIFFPTIWLSVAMALGATWFCLYVEGLPLHSVGLSLNMTFLKQLLAGLGLGAGIMLTAALGVWLAGGVRWTLTPSVGPRDLAAAFWFFLAVAINEELLTRGYPFQRLVQGLGAPWGLTLFAALFALLHWGNPGMAGATRVWATATIGLSALLLGLAYLRTGSLALPIGIHLGWNWIQGSLLGFGVSGTVVFPGLWTPTFTGKPAWITGGAFGLEASLPGAVACLLATLALGFWKGSAHRISGGASTASAS